jgi:Flp pilus assembly protein TadD
MRWLAYTGMAVMVIMFVAFSGQHVMAADPTEYPALELAAGANSNAKMHNDEGIKQYNGGYPEEAEKHFSEAVKADPKSAEAHYNLALSLDSVGQHKDAAAEFKKALDLGAKNPAIANSMILKKHLGM